MKSFLETYGIAIFTLVVIAILIAFAGPFGLRIKQYMLDKANYTHQIGTEEIDKATNGDMQKKIDPTDIYAMLYADGELVLSPRPITPEKEVYGNGAGNYGKVVNPYAVPWNPNPFSSKPLSIQKVRLLDTIAPTSCSSWFMNCENLTEISNFEKLNVSNCNYFTSMFDTCTSLVNIDGLSNWNVSNGKDFQEMFNGCTSLVNIDGLSNWNVSNGNYFTSMFDTCTSLVNLDALKNWNVSNAKKFLDMFKNCTSLVNIDGLSNWNVSNVTIFRGVFYKCTSLVNIDGLKNWNVSNGNDFQYMFDGCTSLTDTSPLVSWLTNGTGMKSDANTTGMFSNVPGGYPFN